MLPWSGFFSTVHCDSDGASSSLTSSALKTVRTAVSVPETEIKRWRRTFDANAKVVNGEKCVVLAWNTRVLLLGTD